MAITSGITTAAKMVFLQAVLNDNCKLALYSGSANIGPDTPTYTPNGEVTGLGYKAGGMALKNCRVWEDRGSTMLTWDSPTWNNATISAGGFMIYDASKGNTALFVGSWGGEYRSTYGPFTVNLAPDQITFA
jgi:hypothetical protein